VARRYHGFAGSVRGADVEAVTGADHPHGHVPAEPAVPLLGGKVKFLGLADAVEFLWCPCRHGTRLLHGPDSDEGLDGPALVHGGVSLRHVVQVGLVVQDQARVDRAAEDVV
jgi:hypothetical protein